MALRATSPFFYLLSTLNDLENAANIEYGPGHCFIVVKTSSLSSLLFKFQGRLVKGPTTNPEVIVVKIKKTSFSLPYPTLLEPVKISAFFPSLVINIAPWVTWDI